MNKFAFPRKFEIYKAALPVGESEILILSSDESNAMRRVVLFCELFLSTSGISLEAPTNIPIPPAGSELKETRVAHVGNVYTLPKNNLLELLGYIRNKNIRSQLDAAIELTFGLRPWV